MSALAISGATRWLGVMADPVAQARSPGLMNALLAERGCSGELVALPLHVASDGLGAALGGWRATHNFAGAIVSMPHKQSICALLDVLTPRAARVGAVNVVRRERDARLVGDVLDGEGFVAGLRAAGREVRARDCLLLGAGGAAAAFAFALAEHGCASLTIVNRTDARAASLAARVQTAFPALPVRLELGASGHFDLAVNATALGMRAGDALPIDEKVLSRCALVAECVLAPEWTPLLVAAQRSGAETHGGLAMLRAQLALMLAFVARAGREGA
jgi:shikimate dehydrogenase